MQYGFGIQVEGLRIQARVKVAAQVTVVRVALVQMLETLGQKVLEGRNKDSLRSACL